MKRAIIYPGSFNPFTSGHQNILEKAEKIFQGDRIMVAIGINNAKHKGLSIEQMEEIKDAKIKTVKGQLPSKEVVGYVGFLTDFVREIEEEGYDEVVVIRGLRNGYDLDYEYTTARYMWDQYPHLSIICIMCDPVFAHVSSSGYRANEEVKSGAGHKYLASDRPNKMIEDFSKVTSKIVESKISAVLILDKETPDMLRKYKIVPFDSVKEYDFKGTYAQCLDWIKEKQK